MLVLPYNRDYNCPCIWTVNVMQSCTLYNDNNVVYHEPRHELYNTGNTIIIELNSMWMAHVKQNTLKNYVAQYLKT